MRDVVVIVIGAVAAFALATLVPWWGLMVAFVVAHFFLFCNVVRMARPLELVWAATFLALAASTLARYPGVQASLHIAARAELLGRFAAAEDDVYLFELEVDGLPAERRWSVAHAKGRELARSAALFVREALLDGAYNAPHREEEGTWSSRANTTRRST